MIARWFGTIQPGQVSAAMVSNINLLPTRIEQVARLQLIWMVTVLSRSYLVNRLIIVGRSTLFITEIAK